MIVLANGARRPLESDVLKAMFEARKRVFVDLLDWDVPVLQGRYEVDEFDDAHATYLVVVGADGRHLGSARLLQTTRPHLLDTLFPALCAAGVPSGPNVLEITRFCLDPYSKATARLHIRNRLVTALVRHAVANGIIAYSGVAELPWLQQVLAFGWRCRPLGLPLSIGGRLLGAIRIDIDENTPLLLARNAMWMPENIADELSLEAA